MLAIVRPVNCAVVEAPLGRLPHLACQLQLLGYLGLRNRGVGEAREEFHGGGIQCLHHTLLRIRRLRRWQANPETKQGHDEERNATEDANTSAGFGF